MLLSANAYAFTEVHPNAAAFFKFFPPSNTCDRLVLTVNIKWEGFTAGRELWVQQDKEKLSTRVEFLPKSC